MKRAKVIGKWIAIVTVILIACLLVLNALFVWSTGTRLESRLQQLRQSGNPVQLSDFAREPIPPERNAESYLRRAADDLDAIHKELAALYPKTAQPPEVLSTAEQEKLEKLFSAYPQVIPLLEQAAACPDYDPQLDCTLPTSRFMVLVMDRATKHRECARVLKARGGLLLSKGQRDLAVSNQILLLRLSRHWRTDPSLLSYLVTVACDQIAIAGASQAIEAGPVTSGVRQALEVELALNDSMEGYIGALRNERSFSLSTVREFPMWGFWVLRGFGNDLQVRILNLFDDFITQADQPFVKIIAGQRSGRAGRGGMNPYGALVTLLVPSLVSVREAAERDRAVTRSLRVLNVLQRRVEPGSDKIPTLADLGLPVEATIDPFNGEPLRVKKLPEGWLVYSVGANLNDDGGILEKAADVGVGPTRPGEAAKNP